MGQAGFQGAVKRSSRHIDLAAWPYSEPELFFVDTEGARHTLEIKGHWEGEGQPKFFYFYCLITECEQSPGRVGCYVFLKITFTRGGSFKEGTYSQTPKLNLHI